VFRHHTIVGSVVPTPLARCFRSSAASLKEVSEGGLGDAPSLKANPCHRPRPRRSSRLLSPADRIEVRMGLGNRATAAEGGMPREEQDAGSTDSDMGTGQN
jgi:hypothetical protein